MADTPENNLEAPRSGRPFLFTDPQKLKDEIQQYFDDCDPHTKTTKVENGYNSDGKTIWMDREIMTEQIPYTITGLARKLKVSRQTLINYRESSHYNDEISPEVRQELMDAIEDAYQRVEEYNERALHRSGVSNGIKFNLTNNFGWEDKKVVDNNNRDIEGTLDDLENDGKAQRDNIADAAAAELAAHPAPAGKGAPAQENKPDDTENPPVPPQE